MRSCARLLVLAAIGLCLTLTIAGCTGVATTASEPLKVATTSTPVVVETAPVRCAKVDPRIKEVFSDRNLDKSLARPAPRVCPKDGKTGICETDTRAWIDALEGAVRNQHVAGKILIKDLETCRGGERPKTRRVKTVPVKTS
jgi:hypothetical protein